MAVPSESKNGLVGRILDLVIDGISFSVFAVLDVVDQILCPVFALLDLLLDSRNFKTCCCYCRKNALPDDDGSCVSPLLSSTTHALDEKRNSVLDAWRRTSDTVYASRRRAARSSRRLHFVLLHRVLSTEADALDVIPGESKLPTEAVKAFNSNPGGEDAARSTIIVSKLLQRGLRWIPSRSCPDENRVARWSDCGCEKCSSWEEDQQHLYVHVDVKDFVALPGIDFHVQRAENNVIFLHGFLSSSSFWTDSVMPVLPQEVRASHRLFALDILGFGKSPKPWNCAYTLADHVDMIERSLLQRHSVQKFHLVAHSMGCLIALALAARFPAAVKSITLLAPPYYPASTGITPGLYTMQQLAPRRIWPLMKFGSAVMSWYEHIGRVVCLLICKNHRIWEPMLNFLHSKVPEHRVPLSSVTDFTQHTHHSAWHLFHNTICIGAHAADYCFEVLLKAGRRVRVIHGTRDSIVPFKQSEILSRRHANVFLKPVPSGNHGSIVFGREMKLALDLAEEFKLSEKSLTN